ncbi:hypothetical protein FH972_023281 [Carpinus fangiana]|uniref:Armadillo-like helical domain-containing protein n=1 Tax=Carpinus fangiana TaxID=176857 RepID=A0A5N6KUS0_9ROSI|nr:hypothetical protein FH972_023281 [Carpinus fangiana]
MTALAGLDDIDTVFPDFVHALDAAIRAGRTIQVRHKAVRATLAVVAGAYQTGLLSYFINRDLFPSLVQDTEDQKLLLGPFVLLGMLVNYNKFEFQNPYQLRVADYINDNVMKKLGNGLEQVFVTSRNQYLVLQPDQDEPWSVGSAFSYLSLGLYKTTSTVTPTIPMDEEQVKSALAELPPLEMAALLPLYDFINANKHFCIVFATSRADDRTSEASFASFLSLSSYTLHNAHRSNRAAMYSCLTLLILRIMVEDPAVAKALCSPENAVSVRLCRQRQPLLPIVHGERAPAAVLLDVAADGVNHNLRRRLDTQLYVLLLGLQLRLITYLGRSRTRLSYHWAELWRSLLSFVRFMNQYADTLKALPDIDQVAALLTRVLALSLSTGENFLPDAKSYDDLFYKVFESGNVLVKFRDAFGIARGAGAGGISVLINVSRHYSALLEEQKGKGNKNISPREVTKLIKQGYDSLSIQSTEGLDHWDIYREADYRNLMKRLTRTVVQDGRGLLTMARKS